MRYFVFDFDGTLADTKAAVHEAYRLAGVSMPSDAWGKPWHSWCSEEVHTRKVMIYQEMLRSHALKTLPAFDVMCRLRDEDQRVAILSGASHSAITAFMLTHATVVPTILGCEKTKEDKSHILTSLCRLGFDVTYVDDEDVRHIMPTHGTFVQYITQDADTLYTQVTGGHKHND